MLVYEDRSPCKTEEEHEVVSEHEQSLSSLYDTDDDSFYAEFGLLFESNHPVKIEHFRWQREPAAVEEKRQEEENDELPRGGNSPTKPAQQRPQVTSTTTMAGAVVAVSIAIADDGDHQSAGAVVSGLYLWPAASFLAEYLIRHYDGLAIQSVVELGAGCGLVSLTALQLWQDSLQCLVVTDHDPNTLGRARDNLETTLQALIMDEGEDDDDNSEEEQDAADQHMNGIINSLASIPVAFESLEWGDMAAVEGILRHQIREHSPFVSAAHMILGSDLIYDSTVVDPLLRTAQALMAPATGRFLLCQSVPLTDDAEAEVVRACHELRLQRRVLVDHNENNFGVSHGGGGCRIEEFSHQQRHGDD